MGRPLRAGGALLPYIRLARLDRPIGTWLLLFPGWWGIALAAPGWPELAAHRALRHRRDGDARRWLHAQRHHRPRFDAQGGAHPTRPMPSGAVSVRQAALFMARSSRSAPPCWRASTAHRVLLGSLVLLLVGTYPLMKRVTYWPQFFLGLNFNWGALMGWAAAAGGSTAPALALCRRHRLDLGYDTIYAHQDKEDDVLIGVKSSALALGPRTRPWLFIFYAAAAALWGRPVPRTDWPFWVALGSARCSWLAGGARSGPTIPPTASPNSAQTAGRLASARRHHRRAMI